MVGQLVRLVVLLQNIDCFANVSEVSVILTNFRTINVSKATNFDVEVVAGLLFGDAQNLHFLVQEKNTNNLWKYRNMLANFYTFIIRIP